MPTNNYRRGRAAEYELKKKLEKEGYTVLRTAGSHGPFDLIAYTDDDSNPVRFIQVKTTKSESVKDQLLNAGKDTSLELSGGDPSAWPTYTQELYVKQGGKWYNY